MYEHFVHGAVIIWVGHTFLVLEVLLNSAHVFLEISSLLLLTLHDWPVLFDPLSDQLLAHSLVDQLQTKIINITLKALIKTASLSGRLVSLSSFSMSVNALMPARISLML